MCGYIDENVGGEGNGQGTNREKIQTADVSRSLVEGKNKEVPTERKCPQCGESKWIPLQSKPTGGFISFWSTNIERSILGWVLFIWDLVTTIFSEIAVSSIFYWKKYEIVREIFLSRILAFLGVLGGVYVVSGVFGCGFDKAAIFMLILYALFKWK
jgi:hypothetical protein